MKIVIDNNPFGEERPDSIAVRAVWTSAWERWRDRHRTVACVEVSGRFSRDFGGAVIQCGCCSPHALFVEHHGDEGITFVSIGRAEAVTGFFGTIKECVLLALGREVTFDEILIPVSA